MVAHQMNMTWKRYGALARRMFIGCATLVAVAACGGGDDPAGPAPTTYKSVTAGDFLTCDLTGAGVAWCWGELTEGGGIRTQLVPEQVETTVRFASLSAYGRHVCGLTSGGDAYCWGPNGEGTLGVGDFVAKDVPTAVAGNLKFKGISAGGVHTCGVTTAGAGYCWGDNVYAQGGHSSTTDVAVPTLVQGGHTWASISAGTINTCGVTTAGAAYCWGSDIDGALGDAGTISYQSSDTAAMPVLVAGGHTWKQVSVGQFHVCGLTTAGAAYCWGKNDSGRLGNNDVDDEDSSSPVAVVGGHVFKSIDAGRYTTCGITTANTVYCWGVNVAGQYGVEAPSDNSRIPVLAIGGMIVAEMNTSSGEHSCAISLDRQTVGCFGRNDYGQLGNGQTKASTVHNWQPTVVVGQHPNAD